MKKVIILVLLFSFILTFNVFALDYEENYTYFTYGSDSTYFRVNALPSEVDYLFFSENSHFQKKLLNGSVSGCNVDVFNDGLWEHEPGSFFDDFNKYNFIVSYVDVRSFDGGPVFFSKHVPKGPILNQEMVSSIAPTVANQLSPILVVSVIIMALILGAMMIPKVLYRLF